jgi:hypothetical protein
LSAPCESCGGRAAPDCARCDNCWEVERRLASFLRSGGERARQFVIEALRKESPPGEPPQESTPADQVLYSIELHHLEELKKVARRLGATRSLQPEGVSIMEVVRYAEALDALRGSGETYVHLYQRGKGTR